MRRITAAEAQAGDTVAEPVINDQGRTLLPKGARLSAAVLSRLQGWGVNELSVEGEDAAPTEAATEAGTDADAGLLEGLEHRFEGLEGDPVMMHIKSVAHRHLSTLRQV